jgi:peptidoglycan hydrolase-like protein with peptidoglycan-binding domain
METLAYLHLALAHEALQDTDYTTSIFTSESLKLFTKLNQQKLSTTAAYSLLSLTLAFSLLGMARQASAAVKEGDSGPQVSAIQQRLQQLGYFKANITGYFGSLTKEAVRQFQQAKGLPPDGVVGKSTEVSLGEQLTSSLQTAGQFSKRVWQLGDRGEQVSAIQESLAVAGFSAGSNGIFDPATQEAVRRFQQAKGLTVDGVVGSQTMVALPAIGGSVPSSDIGRSSSRSDIRALQRRLQSQGFYNDAIDGVWGSRTQAAVESARRAYRVSADDLTNGGF